MIEQDVIEHLFFIEREAAQLLSGAQDEYNKRIEKARSDAEELFSVEYAKIIQNQEKIYADAVATCDASYLAELDAYKKEVSSLPQDKDAFNSLLEQILFKM